MTDDRQVPAPLIRRYASPELVTVDPLYDIALRAGAVLATVPQGDLASNADRQPYIPVRAAAVRDLFAALEGAMPGLVGDFRRGLGGS